MSKQLNLCKKILDLKKGEHFFVKTSKEQRRVCTLAKALREGDALKFDIVTKRNKATGAWKVAAI
jgi:hypothetical protein